jgi:N-acetylglutamate synthase-like GNAT family acetyltransferase
MSIVNYTPEDFPYTIRRATAQDIDAIYDLIQGTIGANNFPYLQYSKISQYMN